ncbi:hypothetical protein ABFT80_02390 [Mesorhizobium sp. SB112]|uniref:hypothetical protein n=1 Tax=Mesorhizobium sp. SB112 TaxID=3151853 RepID=UPI003265AE8B
MHILIAVVGLMGAAAFWWYRVKYMSEAANEVVDAVGRVRGSIKRKKLRKQAALSPLTAVDDPILAAATLITAIFSEDTPLTPVRENAIREVISGIADPKKTDEAVIYGKWAASQIDDSNIVIDKLSPFMRERLEENERLELLKMIDDVAAAEDALPPLYSQKMRRLRQKLGFEIN